eukprot:363717-Chlamydomonas_euryale.AAC.14
MRGTEWTCWWRTEPWSTTAHNAARTWWCGGHSQLIAREAEDLACSCPTRAGRVVSGLRVVLARLAQSKTAVRASDGQRGVVRAMLGRFELLFVYQLTLLVKSKAGRELC